MPLFLCRWPNGDLSVVSAEDEGEAVDRLDEIGDANDQAAILVAFPDFMVHFKLPDEMAESHDLDATCPPLTFDGFGWETEAFVAQQLYPDFHEAANRIDFFLMRNPALQGRMLLKL